MIAIDIWSRMLLSISISMLIIFLLRKRKECEIVRFKRFVVLSIFVLSIIKFNILGYAIDLTIIGYIFLLCLLMLSWGKWLYQQLFLEGNTVPNVSYKAFELFGLFFILMCLVLIAFADR